MLLFIWWGFFLGMMMILEFLALLVVVQWNAPYFGVILLFVAACHTDGDI
jgi:hypothetical protein